MLREAPGRGEPPSWDQLSPVLGQPPGMELAFGGEWQEFFFNVRRKTPFLLHKEVGCVFPFPFNPLSAR